MSRNLFTSILSILLLSASVSFAAKEASKTEAPVPAPYPSWRLTSKEGKTNVCSITINSSEEIEMFKRKLGNKNFNYIELTTLADQDPNGAKTGTKNLDLQSQWLQYACNKQIKCDVLVVSGHFGGTFFGSTNFFLSMEDLEKASCSQSCDGILQNPKEVFLFGCNTLAGKALDTRTPEEYRQVLLADGFSPEQAEQVVAFRYSPLGHSYFDRMRRVFRGTSRIYGFDSIGPSGKSVEGLLEKYFDSQGKQYYFPENLKNLNDALNVKLAKALSGMPLTQTSGAKELTREQIPICYLNNPTVPFFNKLHWVEKSLNSDNAVAFLPAINEWFVTLTRNNHNWRDKEFEVLEGLTRNQKLRASLEAIVKDTDTPILGMQLKVLSFMKFLGWINTKELSARSKDILLGNLSDDYTIAKRNQACDYAESAALRIDIDVSKIPNERFKDPEFIDTLGCVANYSKPLLVKILSTYYQGPKDYQLDNAFLRVLAKLKIPADGRDFMYQQIFPSGDHVLSDRDRTLLCNKPRLAQWNFGGLNKSLMTQKRYIEDSVCYHQLNSVFLKDLKVAAARQDLQGEVTKALSNMTYGQYRGLSISQADQLDLYQIINLLPAKSQMSLMPIWAQMKVLSPVVESRLKDLLIRIPEGGSFKYADDLIDRLFSILPKEDICSSLLDVADRLQSAEAMPVAMTVLTNYTSECLSAEKMDARLPSLIQRTLKDAHDVNSDGFYLSELHSSQFVRLIVDQKIRLQYVSQVEALWAMRGNVLSFSELLSVTDVEL